MRTPYLLLPLLFACGSSDETTTESQGSQTVRPDVHQAHQTPVDPVEAAGQAMAEAFADELAASMQASFDEHMRIQEQGGTVEEITAMRGRFDATTAISVDEAREAWLAPSELQGQTVEAVMTALGFETGLAIDTGSIEEHLSTVCEVDPTGKSAIQMMEETCRSIGVTPVFPNGNPFRSDDQVITFEDGVRSEPVVFAGPFMVRVSEVQEFSPYAAGSVRLEAVAMNLPESLYGAGQSMGKWLEIESVKNAQEASLRSREDMQMLTQPNRCMNVLRISMSDDLAQLVQTVESIASVEGKVAISIPTEVHEVSFDTQNQQDQTVAGFEVKLKRLGKQCEVSVKGDNADKLVVMWSPSTSDDEPMGIQHQSSYFFDDSLQASLSVPQVPASVRVKLLETQTFSFPFEITDIPLEKFESQPTEMVELAIEGNSPVTFQFVEFKERDTDFPKVTLKTKNYTNKDIKNIQANFLYYDSLDNQVKDSYTTLQASFFGPEPTPMVAAGETNTSDQPAFFMPKETHHMKVTLHSIEFMDGTTWQKDQ